MTILIREKMRRKIQQNSFGLALRASLVSLREKKKPLHPKSAMKKFIINTLITTITLIFIAAIRFNIDWLSESNTPASFTDTLRRLITGAALTGSSLFALTKTIAERKNNQVLLDQLSRISGHLLYFLLTAVAGFFFFFSFFPVR